MTVKISKICSASFDGWVSVEEYTAAILQGNEIHMYDVKVGICGDVKKVDLGTIPYWNQLEVFEEMQRLYNGTLEEPVSIHYNMAFMLDSLKEADVKMPDIQAITNKGNKVPLGHVKADLPITDPAVPTLVVRDVLFSFPNARTTRAEQLEWIHKIIDFANGAPS